MKRTLLILISLLCLVPAGLRAQGVQSSIQALNEQIARAEEEIRRNEALLSKIKGERAVTQNELKLIVSRISNRQSIVSSLNQQIAICERDIAAKNKEITETNRRIEVLKKEYADMIYAAYKNYLLNNSMAFLFASRDFGEMTLRINYMKRYNRMREAKASELDSLSAVLQDEVKRLDAQLAQLETSRSNRDKELQTFGPTNRPTRRTVRAGRRRTQSGRPDTPEGARKAECPEAASAARRRGGPPQCGNQTYRRRGAGEGGTQQQLRTERGQIPLSGKRRRNHRPFRQASAPHAARLDDRQQRSQYRREKGAPVRCIFEGTVSRVVFIKGLNNCVMVNHGNYYTVYSNLESVSVKANDAVGRNQVIGNLPSTANNDDWYLHFELWKGTTFLNPGKVAVEITAVPDAASPKGQARTRTTADNTAEKIMAVFRNGL